ncbi:MAG TPA: FkbM family methyltransferase [Candidatus Sulfotelmatobacter sp.]|nr:FkbM family methyltransferase [Candidatus Sulfotelmatobacter sp.]
MSSSKWSQAAAHFFPSVPGFSRMLLAHPGSALSLLSARFHFFSTHTLKRPFVTRDGFLVETPNQLASYWSFFVEGECRAPEWVNALRTETEPLVVDVGANAGLFTHFVWTMRPDTRFILFEPLPRMAKKIEDWSAKTHASVVLHNKAVSNYCGTTSFFACSESDDTASLDPEAGGQLKFEVPVVTLDSILPDRRILVLKIDVEGFECDVLAGAKQTLQRARYLIIEAHSKAALHRIKQTLGNEWLDKPVGASDYFFSRVQNLKT